jgi:CRISPR-associated protein Cas5d
MTLDLPRSRDGHPPLAVQIWGDAALFTRPEFKSERLTYPVITPTAAVGLLSAILWKPELRGCATNL